MKLTKCVTFAINKYIVEYLYILHEDDFRIIIEKLKIY